METRNGARIFIERIWLQGQSPWVPTVLREGGYSVMIFTREPDEPAHVHVLKDRRIAKFWLAELEPARNSGYRPHEIEEIRRIIKKHRVQLVKSYEKFHGKK